MSTIDVTLPDALGTFVAEQVTQRGFRSHSDYIHDLILADRDRQQLRTLLLEGAESELMEAVDARTFAEWRDRVRRPEGR